MKLKLTTAALVIILAACSTLNYLQIALAGLIALGPAAGLPPAVINYANAAYTCVEFASDELKSTDSKVVQAAKISEKCASSVTPVLPPGTPMNIAAQVQKIAKALGDFLANLPKGNPSEVAIQSVPVNSKDADKLTEIHESAVKAHKNFGAKK